MKISNDKKATLFGTVLALLAPIALAQQSVYVIPFSPNLDRVYLRIVDKTLTPLESPTKFTNWFLVGHAHTADNSYRLAVISMIADEAPEGTISIRVKDLLAEGIQLRYANNLTYWTARCLEFHHLIRQHAEQVRKAEEDEWNWRHLLGFTRRTRNKLEQPWSPPPLELIVVSAKWHVDINRHVLDDYH